MISVGIVREGGVSEVSEVFDIDEVFGRSWKLEKEKKQCDF